MYVIFLLGTYIDQIKTIGEFMNFKPKFASGGNSYTEMSQNTFLGKFDIGVPTPISLKGFIYGDYPAMTIFTQMSYHVPTPKPIEAFFQIIRPFDKIVWIACLVMIITFGLLFISVGNFHTSIAAEPGYRVIQQKSYLDYFLYPIVTMIEPVLDNYWMTSISAGTVSGLLTMLTLIIGGFFVTTFYKSLLLAHLTAVGYDRTPENVDGKNSHLILMTMQ